MRLAIEAEGQRISTLINEFLDISKIESGNMDIQFEKTNISQIINEVILSMDSNETKKINLAKLPDEILINADTNKIKQVLSNILDNALRYTKDDKKIFINILDDDEDFTTISIKDEGIGINPEECNKIFEKFYKSKTYSTGRGSGLGLAIAKGIVEMHKEKIWVISELGKGSDFRFSIPKYYQRIK